MECVVVQDIFLNETAKYAHVFLPGSSFLEKDGTFTNAERRISRVTQLMQPLAGYADWEVTQLLSKALGYPMNYGHPARSWPRSRADPTLRRELREDRAPGQRAVALQRRHRRGGHAIMHKDSSCAARAASSSPSTWPPTRRSRSAFRCC
jgi:predicted molibdopterin-dependent oxidoreductase YjgC